ncbi:MAG: DUF6089 family protein [Bacteroidota bacterium]|nr:DUF6089 family protein [Bacteroidota bacterium]
MRIKIFSIIAGAILSMPLFCFGQILPEWEVGVMAGMSGYQGDLTPGIFDFNSAKFAGGILVRYNVSRYFTLKGNVYLGAYSGDDRNSTKPQAVTRNLAVYSNILDIGANAEINLGGWLPGSRNMKTCPYVFGGFSVFKFDPENRDPVTGNYVRLQPLRTEGQETERFNERKRYSLSQISLPFGLGIKHNLNDHWNIGFEFGARKTFTDYLDDVSTTYVPYDYLASRVSTLAANMSNNSFDQNGVRIDYDEQTLRGNSTNKDWYLFTGIILSYNIIPNSCYRF